MISLKKYLTVAAANLIENDDLKGQQLILFTTAGVIMGRLVSPNDSMAETFNIFYNSYKDENNIPDNSPLDENDGYIALSNVTVFISPSSVKLPFLVVFFDEIVGVSIGAPD